MKKGHPSRMPKNPDYFLTESKKIIKIRFSNYYQRKSHVHRH
jgi:hypothetical protein